MEVLTVQNYELSGYAFIHDFAITEDSILLMVNASSLHLKDFVLGRKGIIHCIHFDKSKPLKVRLELALLNELSSSKPVLPSFWCMPGAT
ncbi:MAG: hypothetical protein HC767_05325 [Akkermansiaceae bacterium]|nr:hypothetical protein [Akkermansiaceae bacterium]